MPTESDTADWHPGSFTKNFSWGPSEAGLRQLYESIKLGFGGRVQDVPRETFRKRVQGTNRPDYIPMNFFLFNKTVRGVDYLVADELVFQSVMNPHSASFDKLALCVFNLSFAGVWNGARAYQRRPALWAHYYVKNRVADDWNWDAGKVSADDIGRFVQSDSRYHAQGVRKLATNLNYLFMNGRLRELSSRRIERWWVDALFLALDRIIEDRRLDGLETPDDEYASLLRDSHFADVSGPKTLEKELATGHLITLYTACGGRERFLDDKVRGLTELKLPDVEWLLAGDARPLGAIHPTNPNVLKTIPSACALLAKYAAGFEVIEAEELATFSAEEFVRRRTRNALRTLYEQQVRPTMTAEELMRITRER